MKNREILAEARYHLKGNYWRAIVIMLIVATIPSVVSYVVSGGLIELIRGLSSPTTGSGIGTVILPGIVFILTWIIASFLAIGEKWSYLQMVDNEKLRIKTVFKSFTYRPGRNIWHNILQGLLIFMWMIVGMIGLGLLFLLANWLLVHYGEISFFTMIFTGMISFIIGLLALFVWLIVIRLWFILSEYILYEDQAVSAYESLKFSRRMMKRNKWQLFKLGVRLFLPLTVLSIILPMVVVFLPLVLPEQIWLWGVVMAVSLIGYFVYAYFIQIRWRASLAVFYRTLSFE